MVHPEKGAEYSDYAFRVSIDAAFPGAGAGPQGPDQLPAYLNVINIAEAQA